MQEQIKKFNEIAVSDKHGEDVKEYAKAMSGFLWKLESAISSMTKVTKVVDEKIKVSGFTETDIEYYNDAVLIKDAFKKNGYDVTIDDIVNWWSEVSELHAAGWLIVDDGQEAFDMITKLTNAKNTLNKMKN